MIPLQPNETELAGGWIMTADGMRRDAVAERVEALVSGCLEKIAVAEDGWSTLFRDPGDGRLWELWYPHSEMHGGGPPALRCVKVEDATFRYPGKDFSPRPFRP